LNPLEQANGIHRLIAEFGLTHDAAAKAVGRSRSAVSNLLRLRDLAKPVQGVSSWAASSTWVTRARSSRCRRGSKRRRPRGWSRKDCPCGKPNGLVHQFAHPGRRGGKRSARAADPDLARLEETLAETLGAKVTIEPKGVGTASSSSAIRASSSSTAFSPSCAHRPVISFLRELWNYMRVRRKYWLLPIMIAMAVLGALIVLSQGSVIAPFIYTLF
jgi:hypothetical protein